MPSRAIYALIVLFVSAGVDLLINLLAAWIQENSFGKQFSQQSPGWLIGSIVVGLLVAYWLGTELQLPAPTTTQLAPAGKQKPKTVTITRLQALLSYAKLRGMGIHLSDILLIGSRIDIDTED